MNNDSFKLNPSESVSSQNLPANVRIIAAQEEMGFLEGYHSNTV